MNVNKSIAQMVTFLISSFWHGFYGGYYITFFCWFSQVHLSGLIFKYSHNPNNILMKLYKKSGPLGYYILWIICNWVFTHNGLYFQILSSNLCI